MNIPFHPTSTFAAVLAAKLPPPLDMGHRLRLVAELCRANALAVIKLAGSGHVGSSLSALDLFTWLHFQVMNTFSLQAGHPKVCPSTGCRPALGWVVASGIGHDPPPQRLADALSGIAIAEHQSVTCSWR